MMVNIEHILDIPLRFFRVILGMGILLVLLTVTTALVVMLEYVDAVAEQQQIQPQPFRFQPPPSLDVRPDYGEPNPCQK